MINNEGTMRQAEAFLTTRSEKETAYAGCLLGSLINAPLVIALNGDLGAGKTVFVKGAAEGLGLAEQVNSPTFVLLKIYPGRLPLYHFDFYRLKETEDNYELGFEEYLPGEGVALVEWAERLTSLLPEEKLTVKIERFFDKYGEGRHLYFSPEGPEARLLVSTLIESLTWRTDGSLNMLKKR